MSEIDDLLSQLPIDQIARQVGASPDEVTQAASAVLPALMGGMQANAKDPGGATSLLEALGQHDNDLLTGGVQLQDVDAGQGESIARHVFGDNQDTVVSRLGGVGGSESLVKKLVPILAPIVLSWLAKRVLGGSGTSAKAGSGSAIQDILGQVLQGPGQGPSQGSAGRSTPSAGSVVSDILGGLLGGGRR